MKLLLFALYLILTACAPDKKGTLDVILLGQTVDHVPYVVNLKANEAGRSTAVCSIAYALTCDCEVDMEGDASSGTVALSECKTRPGVEGSCDICQQAIDYSTPAGARVYVSRTHGPLTGLN